MIISFQLKSQNIEKAYQEAEKWLDVSDKIYNSNIYCNWIDEGDMFWYKTKTRKGHEYFIVDVNNKTKDNIFDQERLSLILNKKFDLKTKAYDLGIRNIKFLPKRKLNFLIDSLKFELSLNNYKIKSLKVDKKAKAEESISPDKQKIAFIKNYNLYIKNSDGSNVIALTTDGSKKNSYASSISWYFVKNESANQKDEFQIDITWSPDSKYIICPKYNRTHAKKLFMYNSSPKTGFRAQVFSYDRALAGDTDLTRVSYTIFDVLSNTEIKTNIPENADFLEYPFKWKNDNYALLLRYKRGYKTRQLIGLNLKTGEHKIILEEKSDTYVDPHMLNYYVCKDSKGFLWTSEKNNWNQLYLYDLIKGEIKNAITPVGCIVREITKVDEKNRIIYFSANNFEKGDPYYQYLYSVNFDGSNMKLLSPGNGYHYCSISGNNKYIFDNYSRVDLPDIYLLRSAITGEKIMDIAKTDISDIVKMGWKAPQMYKLKARDNKTDIYGVIYRPFNMSADKKYPIIDGTYSGPQTIRTPKTFLGGLKNMDVSLAQLGFVVITIDGLGSAFRDKTFHDFSYKNLGDIGCLDHIKAIKEIAAGNANFDVSRVGIYGHSAGGYDATRALIIHPEFYSVAVSSAGNHDHRIAKAWWPELYMGFPVGKHYDEQSNFLNASKLKGKLLLVHGNMDNNVNPTSSMRMADALINANKDFELLLIPNCNHSTLYYNKYFLRKRWDFFTKNLKQIEIPKEYKIK